jgi:hypothetical protein
MKALDSWARQFGYSDFDTYIRGGGSVLDAAQDIAKRIRVLSEAMKALPIEQISEPPGVTLEQAKEVADRGVRQITEPDEPPDPENAQIQGAEHGEP